MKKTLLKLALLFIILLLPFTLLAQGITTASFNGSVTDQNGGPLV